MQLKTFSDFTRPFADNSAGTALTLDSLSPQMQMATDTRIRNKLCGNKRAFLFEGSNDAADITSHLISNSLSSSSNQSRKRMKLSDRLSPLSLPRNDSGNTANMNRSNNSVISSSNSSVSNNADTANQAINNNVPFATNNWWKKGSDQVPDLMSSALPQNMNTNGINNSLENRASSCNQNGVMHSPQHQMLQQQQQQLQALRMQGNGRTNISGNNNAFLMGSPLMRLPSSLNNDQISRMTMQSRLPQGNMLDSSNFLTEGMNMRQFQLQQQQQQLLQQQQFQMQQQSLLGLSQGNGTLFSAQNPFLQQHQNQAQRQQMQRPAAAPSELKINGIRAPGDIGVAPLPSMEGSIQQNTPFGGSSGVNGVQKSTSQGQKRKETVEIMDVNDLVFSDMVPMLPSSGSQTLKVEGFDDVDVDVGVDMDSIVVGNKRQSRSPSLTKSQNKPSSVVKQSPKVKEVKFRAYQAENWTEKFEELLRFREENGHCLVPNCHPDNPALAQWTKRQRYQYKLKQDGKRSTITDERVRALDEAGFVWDSHKAVWAERLEELKEFKKQYNHCNVPSRYKPNHQLAIWVKRQRRQWKNKVDRLPNCMTDERQRALEAIGFVWDMKKGKKLP